MAILAKFRQVQNYFKKKTKGTCNAIADQVYCIQKATITKGYDMKTHLTYKTKRVENGIETLIDSGAAFCGNNNRNYKYGLKVLFMKEFKRLNKNERCSHCEEIFLKIRNKEALKKGNPTVELFSQIPNVNND